MTAQLSCRTALESWPARLLQLERLQRLRGREAVPAPMAVELSERP